MNSAYTPFIHFLYHSLCMCSYPLQLVAGFIVVAACVMTFEARDSAAKVVPARFKLSTTSRTPRTNSSSRRTTGKLRKYYVKEWGRGKPRLSTGRTLSPPPPLRPVCMHTGECCILNTGAAPCLHVGFRVSCCMLRTPPTNDADNKIACIVECVV